MLMVQICIFRRATFFFTGRYAINKCIYASVWVLINCYKSTKKHEIVYQIYKMPVSLNCFVSMQIKRYCISSIIQRDIGN